MGWCGTMALLLAAALTLLFVVLVYRFWQSRDRPTRYRRVQLAAPSTSGSIRCQPKPEWVIREIVRLKALSSSLSCRQLAETFNRHFGDTRDMTVGKTFVAATLRKHTLEILRLRREIKHRVPPATATNRIWGLDLTCKSDASGRQRIILGLIDHGSRACLRLQHVTSKSSLSILHELVLAMRRFGIPKLIRTDNEACFTSVVLCMPLRMLGIRLQRSAPNCPWQNGRIERLFGTLKAVLNRITVLDGHELSLRLAEFRCFYNHVRPHQHLAGRTPAEAWDERAKANRRPEFVHAWDGLLSGWYFST